MLRTLPRNCGSHIHEMLLSRNKNQQIIQIIFQSCFLVRDVKHRTPTRKKLTGFFCPRVNALNWHGKIVGEVIGAWRCRFLCIDSVFCFLLGRAHHDFLWGQRRKMERLFILTCNVMPPAKDVDNNVSSYPNTVGTYVKLENYQAMLW